MIDTENLRTASLYINNQLLSRGLLRDGQSIDFASPAMNHGEDAATMGRIVSVLNDLIIRRDRDAEHRESLSATMRSLRAENLKHANDIARLTEKNIESKRKVEIAEASETALKTQMKSADAAIRSLKEEVARTKGLVAQARAACATDVRRRDRQIDTLKKQLGEAGRARGSRGNSAVMSITITGDIGGDKGSSTRGANTNTNADDYELRNETNMFLAKLAQDLSEENTAILNVMRRTMQQLREMSGWNSDQDSLATKEESWEDMGAELDSVLDHMRTILTNPSFVPIEEVEVREEEIAHLKDGWVKMESRWTEAVHLIDGWRKRMAASGRPVCDEELQMGLRLSPVRVKDVEETRQAPASRLSAVAEELEEDFEDDLEAIQSSPCPSAHVSPSLRLVDDFEQDLSDAESDFDEHVPVEDYDVEEPNVQILQQSTAAPLFQSSLGSSPLPEPPKLSPLKDSATAGNRGPLRLGKPLKRLGDFTTIVEENTWDLAVEASKGLAKATTGDDIGRDRASSSSSLDEVLLVRTPPEPVPQPQNESPRPLSRRQSPERSTGDSGRLSGPPGSPKRSRLPLPRNAEPAPQQSPLTMATIAAKLAASEREADAARVRAKLRAARGPRGVKKPTIAPFQETQPSQPTSQEKEYKGSPTDVDPIKRDRGAADDQLKPEKRRRDRRTSKTASRRRSTLSPWELESLMAGNVQ
ncbi:Afadin and alpha-actinin-binding-domain-containing protein [Dactylonectria macrodidyma]|uniref:Afadin and alpha-actinin-binding-domain-containing protein n=1 Tax=Dactylonectria macrodidyma TaxID=307937 RepID=A0A9P9J943_9HYPO|nr:Afadin and alpha-actinin-binding-domain-containing protein [Dactylonectria macrodidyma]